MSSSASNCPRPRAQKAHVQQSRVRTRAARPVNFSLPSFQLSPAHGSSTSRCSAQRAHCDARHALCVHPAQAGRALDPRVRLRPRPRPPRRRRRHGRRDRPRTAPYTHRRDHRPGPVVPDAPPARATWLVGARRPRLGRDGRPGRARGRSRTAGRCPQRRARRGHAAAGRGRRARGRRRAGRRGRGRELVRARAGLAVRGRDPGHRARDGRRRALRARIARQVPPRRPARRRCVSFSLLPSPLACVSPAHSLPLHAGTFSSVYKAVDLHHESFDNSSWQPQAQARRGKVYVAVKRIYVTSSPSRIHNELEILHDLRCVPLPLSLARPPSSTS